MEAILYTNCIDSDCLASKQPQSNTVYICIDLDSCRTVASSKVYFTLPTQLNGTRHALDLTSVNGWISRYYFDIISSPVESTPTGA